MKQAVKFNQDNGTQCRLVARRPNVAARQGGMSIFTVLIILSIAAFLGLFAFKVVPNYMEYWTVKSIGTDIANNTELMKKPKSKVMQAITASYRANSLWELKPEESFVLTKDAKRGYKVTIDYEKRATLFHNIDVVTRFDHTFGEEEI